MTDEHRPDETPEGTTPQTPRREASVQLRRGGADARAESEMFDPANQSLAEALRFSYKLLLLGIAVLVVLFFGSGFKTIEEGRVGIRTTAGAITGRNLQPGMRWSWPQPIGEILTFHRNPPRMDIREAFYPGAAVNTQRTLEQLAQTAPGSLNPRVDGSLITGDLNLAHAQWVVQYSRRDVDDFAENIHPEYEERIVQMTVQRGVVHAVASASLADVIKSGGQSDILVAERARIYAQQMLDDLNSGLRIDVLDMQRTTVPLGIYQEWSTMAGADADAAKTIDEARSQAAETLNQVAGPAAPFLIEQINRYERAVALNEIEQAQEILDVIHGLLDGRPVEIDGETVQVSVAGTVASMMESARQYRTTVASRERARVNRFLSVNEQFKSNPTLVVHREWADAYRVLRAQPFVQMMQVPSEAEMVELLMSPDPEIVRQMQIEGQRQEAEANRQRRLEQIRRESLMPKNPRIMSAEPD